MNYDLLTKKENRRIAEYIYGIGELNSKNNGNIGNNNDSDNTKQQKSKKNAKGVEIHPLDVTEGQAAENSIREIPIGFPVDEEKLKDLKRRIKKEEKENGSVQENGN
jgi:hypothetical protein